MKKLLLSFLIFAFWVLSLFSQICLGFDVITDKDNKNIMVYKVFKGSVADNADLKNGDKIIMVNGKKIKNLNDLKNYFVTPLKKYNFVILRDDKKLDRECFVDINSKVYLGVLLKKTNFGVIISKVIKDSPASNSKLKEGDIILKIENIEIKSPQDVSEIINKIGFGKTVNILINTHNQMKNIEVILYHWVLPKKYENQNRVEFLQDLKHIINLLENRDISN